MYPRNSASPPRIALGPVVQISDGAVQSSGVSVAVRPEGGSESAGGGTISYGGSSNVVYYAPTQAETNYTAFVVVAYKTGCIPVSQTIVTADPAVTDVAGRLVSMITAAPGSPNEFKFTADALQATQAILGVSSANLDTQLAAILTAIGTRLASSSYTAPNNAGILSIKEITDRFYAMLEPAPGSPNEFRWSADALQRVQTVLGFAAGNADAQLNALLAAVATRASQSSVDTLAGYVDTEVAAILAAVQLIQIVTDKLGTTLQSAPGSPGEYRFTEDSLEMAPAGTGGGGGGPSAGAIAQAVWDEILSGHVAAGSAGLIVQVAAGVLAKLDTTVEPAGGSPGEYKLTADALRAVIDRVLLVKADTASALTAIDAVPTNSELATALAAADDAVLAAIAALSIPTAIQNADALLNRDMSAVSDTNARTPLNALRFLRNKWAVAGSTLTVKKEDDTTDAWTATVSTTPGADPVTGNDPA